MNAYSKYEIVSQFDCGTRQVLDAEPNNRVLVVYDDTVETVVPAGPIGDRSRFHAALRGVRSGGSTNLHGGWLRGAETLAPLTNAGRSRA